MFEFLYEKFEAKLKNIDSCFLRGEYKLNIYSRYALISMRYHLSVHDLHTTHLTQLDSLARKYLKKWLHIPSHGASDIAIFHPYLLNIKTPSQLYQDGQAGNFTAMRIKGDSVVNHALDSRLQRESAWTTKSSATVSCQRIMQESMDMDKFFIPTSENTFDLASSRKSELFKAKKAIKETIQEETVRLWNSKVEKLVMQGDLAKLLIEEKENMTWQSIIRNVPRGVLSFALNSATNTLPTPDNLRRWGKRNVSKCPLCGNNGTLEHILNFCPVALKQGRFTWRHNSVLSYFTNILKENKPDSLEIFSDIPGHDLNGGTIPPDVLVTSSRPDLVILDRTNRKIFLLELTCSFESNIQSANALKTLRYTPLKLDLEEAGFYCNLVPFEIGSRGYVSKSNRANLINTFVTNGIKANALKCIKMFSKLALLSSYSIFQAYTQPTWRDPPFLKT